MRSFAGVGERFMKDMITLEGTGIRGTIMPASDREGSPFEFSAPRVVLRTRVESEVQPGTVFRAPGGPLYLVGDHFAADNDYRSWLIFLLERQYKWERPVTVNDPLTGLPTTDGKEELQLIWASVEHDRRMFSDPGLRLKTERVTLITNMPVRPGDLLDGNLVTRVTQDLGLYIVEHQ